MTPQHEHRGPDAEVGEDVDERVNEHAAQPQGVEGDDAEQRVAGVRDRRVGQHALHVVLRDSGQIAQHHRQRGDGGQHVAPVELKIVQGEVEDAGEDREGCRF